MRIRLLADFQVTVGFRTIDEGAWRLRKAAACVKLLALAPDHRMRREQVMDVLWPNLGRNAASNNLRRVLHAARRALDPDAGFSYLVSEGGLLVLCPRSELWVDVEAFERASATARRALDPAAYRAAIDLYAGELLPRDLYEEWTERRREALRQTFLSLLVELACLYEERGEHGPAVEALRRAVTEEPTLEEAHAGLMRLYALSGRRRDALQHYELLREVLFQEFAGAPDATTQRLREDIAAGRFPLGRPASLSSPQEQLYASEHNLPTPRTRFVGREREMLAVKRALAMTRMLTLTGAGGSGKTRLALEVARDLIGAYADGVWLVELAGLSQPELVVRTVATTLKVRERPGHTLLDILFDTFRDKEMLLVLDNCEHLKSAVAELAEALLDSCRALRMLATSRESLGMAAELDWIVPSLSTPRVQQTPRVVELESYESVRLFADRACARHPDFRLTPDNAGAVTQVCAGLEGVPLAIELAAARVGMLSARQIAERIGNSLKLLTGGDRTMDPRHRTLRATLNWSHQLLNERERMLFRRLSVFAGGWSLEAAESVGSGSSLEETDVLDLLGSLVEKFLLVAEESWESGARYRMLDPVRQFARERLEDSREAEEVQRRHAAYFLALAERAQPELKGRGQVEWLELLEGDHDNLRAAMAWLLEGGEIADAVRLAFALWIFWLIHGHQGEGRRWIEEALAKAENLTAHERAKALWVQASTYYGLGSPKALERICEEAATLFRRVGDERNLAFALAGKATSMMQRGDADQALALFKEAEVLSRKTGEKWGTSGGLGHMGSIYLGHGDYRQAARCFEEGLALAREIGNNLAASAALYGLALAARGQGDPERAVQLYAEGLVAAAEAGDRANIAYSLEGLAHLAAARGEAEHAACLFGAAEAALEAAGRVLFAYAQDRSAYEQAVDALRSLLDEAAFSAAWARGRTMSLDETVEYALSGRGTASTPDVSVPEAAPTDARLASLTRRQEEIAVLIAQGMTNRQIARELSISEHTVANHVAGILRKLGLDSRSQITTWVMRQHTLP